MFIKTVSTTSGINPIKFDETGGVFYWILNTGLSTVYASTKSTFTAGDDGVVSLGPKESRRLETNNDTIYILGAGQVEIHNQRDGICSFKQAPTSSGSGGGGTIDAYSKTESDAKYAAKSDVPDAYTKTESDDKYAQKTDVVPYKMGMDFGTCTTPAETVVKSVTTMHKVAPALGAVFAVKFNNAVPAQARLNINGLMGYIQYRGGSIPNGVINAGDIATFIYYSSSGFNTFEILSVENGGNAATVGGVGIANLRQITQTVINTLPAVPNGEGDFLVNCDTSDTSFPYWYGHLSIRYGSYTGEYVAIFRTTGNDNKIYYNTYLPNRWNSWQEIYASYNKPYVMGTFTVNASDTEQTIGVPLTFNPSVVLLFTNQVTLTVPKQIILIALSGTEYKIKIGVPNSGDLSALSTGFEAIINSWKGTASTIEYIAYK